MLALWAELDERARNLVAASRVADELRGSTSKSGDLPGEREGLFAAGIHNR